MALASVGLDRPTLEAAGGGPARNLAAFRCEEIKRAFSHFTDFHLSPSMPVLQAVCQLDLEKIVPQSSDLPSHSRTWTAYRIDPSRKGIPHSFFVSCKEDLVQIVIPVWKLCKCQKAAYEALQVTYKKEDPNFVALNPVFRATIPFLSKHVKVNAQIEVAHRIVCNRSPRFPALHSYGLIRGNTNKKQKKIACKKMMLIEEYYPMNLHEMIENRPDFLQDQKAIVTLLSGLLEALAFLHSQGIVHCDLKFTNVLVNSEYKVALTDLGLSVPSHTWKRLRGTPCEYAPEIVHTAVTEGKGGTLFFTPSLDMWNFGTIAYRLFYGDKRIDYKNYVDFHMAIMRAYKEDLCPLSFYPRYFFCLQAWTSGLSSHSHPLSPWLSALLKVNSSMRLTAAEALRQLKILSEAYLRR